MRETRGLAHLKKQFPRAHFQRVETWAGSGVPDTNCCMDGVEAWIELKQVSRPKTNRGLIKPKVKPEQIAWEALRRAAGGRTWVGLMVDHEFYLLRGKHLKELGIGISQTRLSELKSPMQQLFLVSL